MSQDLAINSTEDHTSALATFFSRLQYDDIPENVTHMAKAAILNSIGCGLSSAVLASRKKMFRALDVTSKEPRPATVLAHREQASTDDAAMLNGLAMTVRFFDDTHLATVVHPSGPPLAAILAYAEAHHLSGQDVVLAFVVGVETMLAIATALGLGPYKRGWHLTSLVGTFGATAAIAKLIDLPPDGFAHALGHAISMTSGTRAVFSTDTLAMHAGRAAQNGLLAAKMAKEGLSSTTHALEKWLTLVGDDESDAGKLTALANAVNANKRWLILENAFKPYPCGIVIHPAIDAGIEAYKHFLKNSETSPSHETFNRIEATVTPLTLKLCGVQHPAEPSETIFSTYHGLAAAIIYGKAGIKEFDMETVNDANVKAIRDQIEMKTDATMKDDQASLTIWYADSSGSQISKTFNVEHATGSLESPMTDKQLEQKFIDQAMIGGIDSGAADAALNKLWILDAEDDIASVMKLLRPAA